MKKNTYTKKLITLNSDFKYYDERLDDEKLISILEYAYNSLEPVAYMGEVMQHNVCEAFDVNQIDGLSVLFDTLVHNHNFELKDGNLFDPSICEKKDPSDFAKMGEDEKEELINSVKKVKKLKKRN